jgi:hypothetical protein
LIISRLGANTAEKVRRLHIAADKVIYEAFKNGLITLFGLLEFVDSYLQQIREIRQSCWESVGFVVAFTTDLSSHDYGLFDGDSDKPRRSNFLSPSCANSQLATIYSMNASAAV